MKLLKVYNLAEKGVVVDTSPIHAAAGELRESKNIIRNVTGAMGGLTNRPGLFHFNGLAANGAILGGISVPFPDDQENPEAGTSGRRLYIGFNGESSTSSLVWGVGSSTSLSLNLVYMYSGDWLSGSGTLSLSAGQSGTIVVSVGIPPFQLNLNGTPTAIASLPPGFTILTLDEPVSPFFPVVSQTGSPDFTILIEIVGSPNITAVPHTFAAPPDPVEVATMQITYTATCGGGDTLTIEDNLAELNADLDRLFGTYTQT